MVNELVFSPLENWNDNDVWVFLMQYKNPWGYSNKELLTLYKGATADNECPMMVEKGLPSCGKVDLDVGYVPWFPGINLWRP